MPLLANYTQGTTSVARHGFVLKPPPALDQPFTVQVPGFDASGAHVYEVTRWMPRGALLPVEGDEVLLIIDDEAQAWVPAWWPL